MKRSRIAWPAALLAPVLAWASGLTPEDLSARFWYDLGPSTVDVSEYPAAAQKGYAIFLKSCAQCHSTARPLNSPIASKPDWQRYVRRMHVKGKIGKVRIAKDEAASIVEFLAYDSKLRKVDRKAEFEAQRKDLEAKFARVVTEREKVLREEGAAKARPSAPYTGAKP